MALYKNQKALKITFTVDTFKISNCFLLFLTYDVQMVLLYCCIILQLFIIYRSFLLRGGHYILSQRLKIVVIYSLNKLQLGSMSSGWDSSLSAF